MPTQKERDNRWAILALLSVAQLMVVLDATIVTVALPSAQRALHFSPNSRQWVVTAYALAFGSLLLLGGKLGDLFGRKWAMIGGLVGFAAASAVGGLAHSFSVLIAARALQGVFGALLAPSALSLLTVTFAGTEDWNKAFGIFGAVAGGGGAVGLLLGGVLTQLLSWRWCLYVNVAIAVPTTLVGLRLLVNHSDPDRAPIDIPGALTWSLGLFALVFGFSNAETHGWGATATVVALIASPVLLTAFVILERRVAHPLMPLHIVWDRARGGALISLSLTGAGVFAVFLFLTYFLQQNLGFKPLKTGLAFLPTSAVLIITSTFVQSRVIQRTGVKPLVLFGMVLGLASMLLFTQLTPTSSYGTGVLPGLLVFGLGMASPPAWSTPPSRSAARSAPRCSQRSTPPPSRAMSLAIPTSAASSPPPRSTATRPRSGGASGSLAWEFCSRWWSCPRGARAARRRSGALWPDT
jgi:EmrB/QacA subfamily drug resistance transporter